MMKDSSVCLLPSLLPSIAMAQLTPSDLPHFDSNEYLVKFFKLLQLANELHANSSKLAFQELKSLEGEYSVIHSRILDKEKKLQERQKKIIAKKKEQQKKERMLDRYQYLIRGRGEGIYYACSN
jgi:hypothetical protein